eukprot:6704598-Pyramimonas_sp.AAC.1
MEEHNCHRIAFQQWADINRQDREQLRAASALAQHIIFEAQENMRTAEEAQRLLAASEAARQAMAPNMEHEKSIALENAQKQILHAAASAAG